MSLNDSGLQLTLFSTPALKVGDDCQLSETEKAYLAGLIDGEGCITIAKQYSKRTPTPIYWLIVCVTSCDKDVLELWKTKTGLGSIQGKDNQKRVNHRPAWNWRLTSQQAHALLEEVYPYLLLKREQADIAFDFQKTFGLTPFGRKFGGTSVQNVNPEIIHQRERYKQALTRMKGHLTRRGRPPKTVDA